jgi:uncharacterized protein
LSFAIDVNILLYASDSGSSCHEKAAGFLRKCITQGQFFCLGWPTVMSYLRIATHPSIFKHPLTPEEAQANIELLLKLPHLRLLTEKEGFWETYKELTAENPIRGNLVPDAHLSAILRQHGVQKLFTHDRDFLRFSFLKVEDPLI